jgi:hypothetical protein
VAQERLRVMTTINITDNLAGAQSTSSCSGSTTPRPGPTDRLRPVTR